MLSFARQILRSSVVSTDKPTDGALEADFFVLDGGHWQSLSDAKCSVTFESGGKIGPTLVVCCASESVREAFSLESISNLSRFMDDEDKPCFQWIVKKGKGGDNMEEFGLRFDADKQADAFASEFSAFGQQSATVVAELGAVDLVEKMSDSEWETIEEEVCVIVSKTKKGEHYLSVQKDSELLFHSQISHSLQIDLESPIMAFVGLTPLHEEIRVLGIHCADRMRFGELEKVVLGILKKPSAPRIVSDSSDVEMWSEAEEFADRPVRSRRRARRRVVSSSSDDEDNKKNSSVVNRHLQLGKVDKSRAIVFSERLDASVGFSVFSTNHQQSASSCGPISSFTKLKHAINPSAVMIHEADAKVLLLDPSLGRDKVFELDLERGSVVNEWTPGPGMSVNAILPVSKTSQSDSSEKTFLGINERAIFVMDPRVGPTNRVRSFNYATNVKLSAAATDARSRIVVSNKNGQLRLFDGQANREGDFKRAKTLLAGLGEAISSVELTADGEWILGTCTNYLVLVRTTEEGKSGFEKSIGNSADFITLALSHQDVSKYKLKSIAFSAAKFDEERGLIVASTGSLAIVWDFAKIKKSGRLSYSVKPMRDFILDAQMVPGAETVVAMYTNKVELARVRK